MIACPVGTYQPLPRQSDSTACVQCPKHATTYATNSTSMDECLCGEGFYNGNSTDGRVRDDFVCVACGVGTDCEGRKNVTILTMPVAPGYYRVNETSVDVRPCPDLNKNANCTDDELRTTCPHTTSSCQGTTHLHADVHFRHAPHLAPAAAAAAARRRRLQNASLAPAGTDATIGCEPDGASPQCVFDHTQCAPGLRGPFCQLCDEWVDGVDDGKTLHWYAKPTKDAHAVCKACRASSTAAQTATVLGVLLGIFVAFSAIIYAKRKLPPRWKRRLAYWTRVIQPRMKLKQAYGFLMVTSQRRLARGARLPVRSVRGAPLKTPLRRARAAASR